MRHRFFDFFPCASHKCVLYTKKRKLGKTQKRTNQVQERVQEQQRQRYVGITRWLGSLREWDIVRRRWLRPIQQPLIESGMRHVPERSPAWSITKIASVQQQVP